MKKFLVETLVGKLVVSAESADALKAALAARHIESDVIGECDAAQAANVMPVTVAEISAECVSKPVPVAVTDPATAQPGL